MVKNEDRKWISSKGGRHAYPPHLLTLFFCKFASQSRDTCALFSCLTPFPIPKLRIHLPPNKCDKLGV